MNIPCEHESFEIIWQTGRKKRYSYQQNPLKQTYVGHKFYLNYNYKMST